MHLLQVGSWTTLPDDLSRIALPADAGEIDVDEPLFGGDATVDSLASLEIIAALEIEFGIDISDDELRIELFDSIRSLADCVQRHRRRPATTAR